MWAKIKALKFHRYNIIYKSCHKNIHFPIGLENWQVFFLQPLLKVRGREVISTSMYTAMRHSPPVPVCVHVAALSRNPSCKHSITTRDASRTVFTEQAAVRAPFSYFLCPILFSWRKRQSTILPGFSPNFSICFETKE